MSQVIVFFAIITIVAVILPLIVVKSVRSSQSGQTTKRQIERNDDEI
ncbi:hypothetical protein GCM10010911_07030 [Paenibacillus nasutitermitis]|uniref:Uncharacterized protein n=1 Tax=Paenibacillus nasutitermitis TaxID=1652958 RepID=A0A916YM35_9BACL|nr:hypothetical protein GCM10010911_07030 [Paenibacillus nasutitermitis]